MFFVSISPLNKHILKFSSQYDSGRGEDGKVGRKTSSSETMGIEWSDPCSVINGEVDLGVHRVFLQVDEHLVVV